jgi:hypothetical protein
MRTRGDLVGEIRIQYTGEEKNSPQRSQMRHRVNGGFGTGLTGFLTERALREEHRDHRDRKEER